MSLDNDKVVPPQSQYAQLDVLIAQTANLMAVNEQLRKEIAENEHQMRALNSFPESRRRGRMQKPESYKTVICQAWLESKTCTFAENCRFAHGEEELRPSIIEPRMNNKYKTKLCDKYTTTGLCPYGKRCLFIHPDHGPNAYIRADKLLEVSQRHALADLRDQMEQHIMTGGRTSAPLDMMSRPCTPDEPAVKMPLGPTPVSTRGQKYDLSGRGTPEEDTTNRPPSSWPLEPSSFFTMDTRPMSPFESMLIGAAMLGKQSTPGDVSGYSSAGSTPSQDTSPLAAAAAAYLAKMAPPMTKTLDESFSKIPGFDQLAEDMAKHLELW